MKKLIFAAAVLGTMFIGNSRANAQVVVSGRVSLPGISIGVNDGPYYRYGHHHHRPRYYAYGGGYYVPQGYYLPDEAYRPGYGQPQAYQPQYQGDDYPGRGDVRERYDNDKYRGDAYENQQGYRGREDEQQRYDRQNQQGQGYEQQDDRYEQPQDEQGYSEQNHPEDDNGYNGR